MSSNTTQTIGVNLGFLEFLALIFITLKLTGYIGWSWWWVLLPIWGQIVIFIVAFIVIVIYATGKGTNARSRKP